MRHRPVVLVTLFTLKFYILLAFVYLIYNAMSAIDFVPLFTSIVPGTLALPIVHTLKRS